MIFADQPVRCRCRFGIAGAAHRRPAPGLPVGRAGLCGGVGGFTLLEVLLAIAIFAGVLAAIYASWSAILRGAEVARVAAEEAQRSRVAVRALEEALGAAQFHPINARHYGFVADTTTGSESLSFVSRLPFAYPRGGRFGDLRVRRVDFRVEPDEGGVPCLTLRQWPFLHEDDVQQSEDPLVLARNVTFQMLFWGHTSREWETEWLPTNQLPRLVLVRLVTVPEGASRASFEGVMQEVVTRVVELPIGGAGGAQGLVAPPLTPGGPGGTNRPPVVPGPGLPAVGGGID
jgi:type II secretion system protein J